MWNRVLIFLTLPLIIGRVYATSGGGDEKSGYYWWSDEKVGYFSGYDENGDWTPKNSYVFYPEKIPWFRKAGKTSLHGNMLWDGSNPTLPPTNDYPLNGSCAEPFISWIELSGWPDNPSADSFYVGHLLAGDGDVVHNINFKMGGKFPPEMVESTHFQTLNWDTLYFFFAGRVYHCLSISSDGWIAFNATGVSSASSGKLPDPTYPNATIAPYWTDFICGQHKFPSIPWKNPSWGAKDHPWWKRVWWDSAGNMHQYLQDEYSYIHADSGAVLWGLRFYRLRLNTIDTAYTGSPEVKIRRVDVWVPVFVIEWCDVALASNPNYHYRFQVQLLNPVPDDTAWTRFVGRIGRPGLTDTVAEPEVAQMYLFQHKVLIPQQIFYLYHSRYDETTKERVFDNSEPPNGWESNAGSIGLEDENGAKGISINPDRLKDMYVLKFDYFKRYNNDLSITIVNPPHHIVLRWTELKPAVIVRNVGANLAKDVPITIRASLKGEEVYKDELIIPALSGLGTYRWATPRNVPQAQGEFEFKKAWIPEEIGNVYYLVARIEWGLDENPYNNENDRYVRVGCEDTIRYHTCNPTGCFHTLRSQVSCSYIPYGGSQIGFSWIQALACWILQGWPDDCYQDFEMALVEDDTPGYGVAGHPNCFYYNYLDYGGPHWTTTIYPSLDMTSPHQGKSADYDGWFDDKDASIGPPNFTFLNRNIGRVWFNDTLYLGDSLAPGCWTRRIAPDLDPARVREGSYPEKNEPDAWMVYFTGMHRLTPGPGNFGYAPPDFTDALLTEVGGVRVNTPYWDLNAEPLVFNISTGKIAGGNDPEDMKGPHGPMYSCVVNGPNPYAIPFVSIPFMVSPYPESIPVHPMLDVYLKTGTYDACLYEIKSPVRYGGYKPGYYFEDHISANFKAKVANMGRVPLTDKPEHRFRLFVEVMDKNGRSVYKDSVSIDSLGVGDSLVDGEPLVWENTGEGGKEYDAIMWVNYDYPHRADHCPYNDTIEFHFSVVWTYDIACSKALSPYDGEEIKAGEDMHMVAEFKNLGYRDTVDIPVKVEVYTALPEDPPDSLLYEKREVIPDLNWKGSPVGPPIADTIDFGTIKVPPSTISPNRGMAMKLIFSLGEDWKDEDPENDRVVIFVNGGYGVADKTRLPKTFRLSNILPNPITSSVVIRYDVPFDSRVSIRVYDVSGKLVKTLVDGEVEAGYRRVLWKGMDSRGRRVARGIYFVRMDALRYTATRKLVMVR